MTKLVFISVLFSAILFASCESEPEGVEVTYYLVGGNSILPYYESSNGSSIVFKGHLKKYVRTETIQKTLKTKILKNYKCPFKKTYFEYELNNLSLNTYTDCLRCELNFGSHKKIE